MSNLLKNNAYHVLGLDTSATQKDIQKRAKEIVKLLQIDDMPTYDLDLVEVFGNFRTEDAVKDALQKLTSPKKQIKEYFFWFHIADEVDQEAASLLQKKNAEGAIRLWERHAEGESTKAMLYKRNLTILYCAMLSKENNKSHVKKSLSIWHELVGSSKFWSAFTKVYKINDELDTDQEIISDLHRQAASFVSDLYTELSHAHKDDSYVAEFTQIFNLRGEQTEKIVLAPIFQEITEVVEKLEGMKVSEDGVMDKEEAAQIKDYLGKIQEGCNKLIDLGLYEDSQSKAIRDRAVEAIRSIVIDIHNNLDDLPKAEQLLNVAMQFVGTAGMKSKLEQDLDQFNKNKKFMGTIAPIMALINDKKYVEAIALIDKEKQDHEKEADFIAAMNGKKKEALTLQAMSEFSEGKKLYDAKKWDAAIPHMEKAASLIYENIELFDVNKEVVDSWLETLRGNIKVLTSDNAEKFDEVYAGMLKKIDEAFEEKMEQFSIKLLFTSYYHAGLAKLIKSKRSKSNWNWLWWIVAIIIIRAIFSGN